MSLHMFSSPDPIRSQSNHDDIRIIKEYTTEDGAMFWPTDTFLACGGVEPDYPTGVEVKQAGDYHWLPRDVFEVIER